jgi:pSer/pThr/pTyr-binding forkhead associated (FHA) protein
MDTSESFAEAKGLPDPGPHWRTFPAFPVPEDFFPLRLILQPSGATIELTQTDMLLGRHSQADVRLPLPDVSRRHCRFLFTEGTWQIFDLNSLNGVFLNEEPIQQASVQQGDLLRIGGFTFVVDLSGQSQQVPEDTASGRLIHSIFKKPMSPDPEPRRRSA